MLPGILPRYLPEVLGEVTPVEMEALADNSLPVKLPSLKQESDADICPHFEER